MSDATPAVGEPTPVNGHRKQDSSFAAVRDADIFSAEPRVACPASDAVAAENLKKAYSLRDRVSEREKFHITADYYAFATGELEKEAQIYVLWMQSYPRDAIPHTNLGDNSKALGQYDKTVAETQEALRLEPSNLGRWETAYNKENFYRGIRILLDPARGLVEVVTEATEMSPVIRERGRNDRGDVRN